MPAKTFRSVRVIDGMPELSGDDWFYIDESFGVIVPMCSFAAVFATCALPWIRMRFGLRTLLIAVSLIAIGLGAIAVSK
jgi:hypothetical protein